MTAKIRVTADFYALRIFISEALHLHIDRSMLLAVQSWCDSDSNFTIEYVLKGGKMRTEYTDRERWFTILKRLEDVL